MRVKEKVITKCVSCKTENLVKQKTEVISDQNIDEFEIIDALVCTNCGTIHDPEGKSHQINFKANKMGFTKTSALNVDSVDNWN